ncbi:Polyketide_cyc domain-containing protein [Trichoderma simmonsii]|uniref:Polyketide_cyc domain-containing protein n=1 Tax=Trichoderma simmonsii TaxID=1491479 RepID=A0A8G0PMC8_9HYPO|nr:Polyketide_cyc domain-containing protein [Trichoderma simmonsii]
MAARTASQRLFLLPRPSIPLLRPSRLSPSSQFFSSPSRRAFISLPGTSPQTLLATRTLPYRHEPLYELIADVDSYSAFVPYCSHSQVTKWSSPDDSGRRWPALADLHVGWGGFDEVFTSRLLCVPGVSVEARSGGSAGGGLAQDASSVFKTLETLWYLTPVARQSAAPSTEVRLTIKFEFVNPLYAAVSAAVSDKIAALMIDAFEKRVHYKLGAQQRL